MTDKEQIKAIIKQYADKGKTQYRECCDDNESASLINYWDGYRDCAYNLLRELEDMQEEPKFKVGDVIRRRDKIGMLPLEKTIIKIDNEKYWLDNGFTLPIKEINQWELVDESERRYPSFEESQGECHPFQDIALNEKDMKKELIKNMVSLIVGEALLEFIENHTSPKIVNDLREKYSEKILSAIDFMQEESTISVWHSAKDEEPTKGRKIVVLTSVCNIADKNLSFMGEYIGNGYVQVFNAKEYMNSWAKWAYTDDLLKL